jgi:hypothetical protein
MIVPINLSAPIQAVMFDSEALLRFCGLRKIGRHLEGSNAFLRDAKLLDVGKGTN